MNVKTVVAAALVSSAFILGNIVLLGVMRGPWALVAHFAFTAGLFAIVLYALRSVFSKRALIMGSVMVVLVALSTVQFASALHAYQDALTGGASAAVSLESQIASLQAKNKYYNDTIAYMSGAINQSQAHVQTLQQRIEAMIAQQIAQQSAPQPAQQPSTTYRQRYERSEIDD